MGFRFQRRVKIGKFVTLNFSKSGVSTSIGKRGAHVTVSPDTSRVTVGAPGTGISYTKQVKNNSLAAFIAKLWS